MLVQRGRATAPELAAALARPPAEVDQALASLTRSGVVLDLDVYELPRLTREEVRRALG